MNPTGERREWQFAFFLGSMLLAMVTVLTFVSLIPWATKAEMGRVESQLHEHAVLPAHPDSQRLHAVEGERLAQLDRRMSEMNAGLSQLNVTSDEILRLLHAKIDANNPWTPPKAGAIK